MKGKKVQLKAKIEVKEKLKKSLKKKVIFKYIKTDDDSMLIQDFYEIQTEKKAKNK